MRIAIAGVAVASLIIAAGVQPAAGGPNAAARLTISVYPSTLDWYALATYRGSLDTAGTGELVEVEAKECGLHPPMFRTLAVGETDALGGWEARAYLNRNAVVRAVWKDQTSAEISVKQRVGVTLQREKGRGRFAVWVVGGTQFWRKRVPIQARRGNGSWRTVRTVVLNETGAQDPTGRRSAVWSRAEFRLSVPRGSLLRAVFPKSQAGPCQAVGVSKTLRI